MRVLLDENLPEGLVEPLRLLGHTVDSVASLRLKGLDNGRLYREVASADDLFFTKDREFANRVNTLAEPAPVRVILTVIRQQPEAQFVAAFMASFASTDWANAGPVREWPRSPRRQGFGVLLSLGPCLAIRHEARRMIACRGEAPHIMPDCNTGPPRVNRSRYSPLFSAPASPHGGVQILVKSAFQCQTPRTWRWQLGSP